jgi:hypothetical protein
MLTAWPAIVSTAVRDVSAGFATTEYVVVPLPVPLVPAVIVIQLALSDAVQAHPLGAVTVSVAVPAVDGRLFEAGDTANVHAAPLCETVTVTPATVSVPVRELVDVFAAIE